MEMRGEKEETMDSWLLEMMFIQTSVNTIPLISIFTSPFPQIQWYASWNASFSKSCSVSVHINASS